MRRSRSICAQVASGQSAPGGMRRSRSTCGNFSPERSSASHGGGAKCSALGSIEVLGKSVKLRGRAHSATTASDAGSDAAPRLDTAPDGREVLPQQWFDEARRALSDSDSVTRPGKDSGGRVCEGRRFASYVTHEPFLPPHKPALSSLSVTRQDFVDFSNHQGALQETDTIYTLEKYKDKLLAAAGGDPRRRAAAAGLEARHGLTEHSFSFRPFSTEEVASAAAPSPHEQAKRRSVREAYRPVRERERAAAMARLQVGTHKSGQPSRDRENAEPSGALANSDVVEDEATQRSREIVVATETEPATSPEVSQSRQNWGITELTNETVANITGRLTSKGLSLGDLMKAATEADGRSSLLEAALPTVTSPCVEKTLKIAGGVACAAGMHPHDTGPNLGLASNSGLALDKMVKRAFRGGSCEGVAAAEESRLRPTVAGTAKGGSLDTAYPHTTACDHATDAVAVAMAQKAGPPSPIVPELIDIVALLKGAPHDQGMSVSERSTMSPGSGGTSRSFASAASSSVPLVASPTQPLSSPAAAASPSKASRPQPNTTAASTCRKQPKLRRNASTTSVARAQRGSSVAATAEGGCISQVPLTCSPTTSARTVTSAKTASNGRHCSREECRTGLLAGGAGDSAPVAGEVAAAVAAAPVVGMPGVALRRRPASATGLRGEAQAPRTVAYMKRPSSAGPGGRNCNVTLARATHHIESRSGLSAALSR